ncbi:phosphoribosylformylglycinamidine synthase subunit PurL [Natranaerofaba carboxydovora]|uniref:phosphoribosylformylglycinamidine synthase subunit PurL n=1 Tax=Natranaerofaba carboxydovora TaxID=2742683 RepID=UPI001F1342A3|nr:phosphoribosylformylglycinamidine synthase subunit PurL [Natranaerofaba carboxydovora]UMZ74540.1 Phosphoribosylformylglycinamidine synthase subunit PurL [Natranaerofaba carboxydovora]
MEQTKYKEVGLTKEEYDKITELMNREPNDLELAMFGVMWSEHCSYKNSKALLKEFPTEGKQVIQGPGENAGVLDIGDGLGLAFKIESHNHPSAIEPYQGAATGVGGILRDIFAMGARPIALLNSLRFGHLDNNRVKFLFDGVVSGIGGYGNCVGIPTVGGEVYFDSSYEDNPLVNAMCVGLVEKDKIRKGFAKGVGNSLILVGSKTGRDGIGGASFASEELTEESEEDRPAVQVGDPFMGKLLLEACQELAKIPAVVGIQDLGAAGLTSSAPEMASRAGTGVVIDSDKIPRREEKMTPYEVMLSESQERMLVIVQKGKEDDIKDVVEKWELTATKIGEVTEDRNVTVRDKDKVAAKIPVNALVDDVIEYKRDIVKPQYIKELNQEKDKDEYTDQIKKEILDNHEMDEVFTNLLASPNIASKKWVYSQYDYMVRTSTVINPGGDGSMIRIRENGKGVALSTDGNPRYVYLDPYIGGQIAVAEAARNVACAGATPLGITNCLNFGSPEKAEGYYQLAMAIKGMSEACKVFDTPVTGGNVSLYNESQNGQIKPNPVVGMVGLIQDVNNRLTTDFKEKGDLIVLLGDTKEEFGGSEIVYHLLGKTSGRPPEIDLQKENRLQELIINANDEKLLSSAHDLSEGGLAAALSESMIKGDRGVVVDLTKVSEDLFTALFSESQSRVVVSLPQKNKEKLLSKARESGISAEVIGEVKEKEQGLVVNDKELVIPFETLNKKWRDSIPCAMS